MKGFGYDQQRGRRGREKGGGGVREVVTGRV